MHQLNPGKKGDALKDEQGLPSVFTSWEFLDSMGGRHDGHRGEDCGSGNYVTRAEFEDFKRDIINLRTAFIEFLTTYGQGT